MQGGSAVAAVFRAHSRLSHLGMDGSGSEPTNTAVAPISASTSRRRRSRSITVSPPPCLASEKSACLFFSTRVNSQELYEKPACPLSLDRKSTRLNSSHPPHSVPTRRSSDPSHLGMDGSGSEPTNTAVAPISASTSRRRRSRSITVSPPPCLASEKSACLFFSTRVNSQELYEKPACPLS